MDDVFARIGLALERLLHQSTVHGPEKEEVARLAAELQAFEGSINTVINQRIAAANEATEGRVYAHIDSNFAQLATVLEAASVTFEPTPPPVPPVVEPPADPVLTGEVLDPAPITGNIPHVPDPVPEPVAEPVIQPGEAETVAGGADTTTEGSAGADSLTDAGGDDTIAGASADTIGGGEGNDTVSGGAFNGAPEAAFDHDKSGDPGGSEANPPTEDPDQMTVKQATDWLQAHDVDFAGVTLRDELRDLVRMKQEDIAKAGA